MQQRYQSAFINSLPVRQAALEAAEKFMFESKVDGYIDVNIKKLGM